MAVIYGGYYEESVATAMNEHCRSTDLAARY